jgi:hypothetical protein
VGRTGQGLTCPSHRCHRGAGPLPWRSGSEDHLADLHSAPVAVGHPVSALVRAETERALASAGAAPDAVVALSPRPVAFEPDDGPAVGPSAAEPGAAPPPVGRHGHARLVEPLTDRQREVWLVAVRWAWIVHAQVVGLQHAADRAYEAQRQRRSDSPQRHTESDNRPFHELEGERHFLLVAAAQLVKAVALLPPGTVTGDVSGPWTMLRNAVEHWDDPVDAHGRLKRSRAAHADAAAADDPLDSPRPEDLSWGAGGLVLGRLGRADELREWSLDVYSRLTEQSPEW